MRIFIGALILSVFALMSCNKDVEFDLEMELESIDNYIAGKGHTAIETDSGLHYVVLDEGSGNTSPSLNNQVNVAYKGELLDGTVFDQSNGITFVLSGLIKGWQEGIQLMNKGDKYLLVMPSTLGYGSQGSGNSIPPNTPLAFEITLKDF